MLGSLDALNINFMHGVFKIEKHNASSYVVDIANSAIDVTRYRKIGQKGGHILISYVAFLSSMFIFIEKKFFA